MARAQLAAGLAMATAGLRQKRGGDALCCSSLLTGCRAQIQAGNQGPARLRHGKLTGLPKCTELSTPSHLARHEVINAVRLALEQLKSTTLLQLLRACKSAGSCR
eukprot:scaffold42027_cov15-Tisochrysis_lutea.AAC.1